MSFAKVVMVSRWRRRIVGAAFGAAIVFGLSGAIARAQESFNLIGSLPVPRLALNGPSAVAALPNGGAFIAGAANGGTGELYNASTGAFSPVDMGEPYQTATLMGNGAVLLACAGVDDGSGGSPAAIYDPQTGAVAPTGEMPMAVSACSATLLKNGDVLIAGGVKNSGAPSNAAAIYDPNAGAFAATGALNQGRYGHTATPLNNGMVLIAGGTQYDAGFGPALSSAELYDPSAGQFAVTGSMATPRAYAAAAPLPDGDVLITGGEATFNDNPSRPAQFWDTAEIYDPSSGSFSAGGVMTTARTRHFAAPLSTGQILIAGGLTSAASASASASAEIYDPATGSFAAAAPMQASRSFTAAAALTNGQVLVAGGLDSATVLSSAEICASAIASSRRDSAQRLELASAGPPRLAAPALAGGFHGLAW